MKTLKLSSFGLVAWVSAMTFGTPVWALTDVQYGSSGKTYASKDMQCAVNPVTGFAPMVQAGLYNPKKSASGTVSLNGSPVATVTFISPDATVWLANGANTVVVALDRRIADNYSFDATPIDSRQLNVCLPPTDSSLVVIGNSTDSSGLEYAASNKSSATVTPGCAWNQATGRAQPYVHLFDNGSYLLNVSVNNVPLTQLNGTTRRSTPVFLSAGLNLISAANATLSTDNYVRNGGSGSCTLP